MNDAFYCQVLGMILYLCILSGGGRPRPSVIPRLGGFHATRSRFVFRLIRRPLRVSG